MSRAQAIARYTEIAHRLPASVNPESSTNIENLSELVDEIDVFVLDGFGVLNVGEKTIPGAVERVAQLQKLGKKILVLTNGATLTTKKTLEKYRDWGMNFQLDDIISSRNALEHAMQEHAMQSQGAQNAHSDIHWGVIATRHSQIDSLAPKTLLLSDNADEYSAVDGFIFLSTSDWSDQRQQLLHDALKERTRPLMVGNPDLVAPREDAMSMEPGFFAHQLADAGICKPEFYGKPFAAVFDLAASRIDDLPPHRIAMVGDTLHTDILGGASYGWRTVLIKNHGLMKEADNESTFLQTGIRPNYIAQTT